MKYPSYKEAIQWIADNDEPGALDKTSVSTQISVVMVADLYDKSTFDVARAVIKVRHLEIKL